MYTYYIATGPEAVAALVQTGQVLNILPDWLEPKQIICSENIYTSVQTSNKNYHQTFILQLELLSPLIDMRKDKCTIVLKQINPNWIKKIFTYSQRGKNLLQRLFADKCEKPIEIKPEIYPKIKTNASTTISAQTSTNFFDKKRKRDDAILVAQKNKLVQKDRYGVVLQRISTKDEHLDVLRSAFQEAKKTILITSFAITYQTLRDTGLYSLIAQARGRGVKIYCYYNDSNSISNEVKAAFSRFGVFYDEAYTHSKILAVDHTLLVLGSFNWLSCIDYRYTSNSNGSIVCRGDICGELIEALWEYLKHYRNIQFGNFWQVERFEYYNDYALSYDIGRNSELTYLTTLEQHLGFFQSVFEEAQHKIIICSPFISSSEAYREDIDHQVLRDAANREVEIFFICSATDPYLPNFQAFLRSVGSSNIYLIKANNFHLKTIIVDDQLIAEGSFNWLSAARDDMSQFHNHETTIFVYGNMASGLIDHFYRSEIGCVVLNMAHELYEDERKTKRIKDQTIAEEKAKTESYCTLA
jgi:phosphatidylserine/phosphatidylglycerophosphate/cardiolipin synthase-like enzyme